MNRGGCKFGDDKTRGCPWPKRGALVFKLVPKLKESVNALLSQRGGTSREEVGSEHRDR